MTVPDGHCHYLGGVVEGPDAIRAAVSEHEQRGVDVIKVMASGGMTTVGTDPFGVQFDAADLRVLVDAAHAVGLPVLAHAHSLAGIRHALAAGVDGIEHFTGLTETGIRVPDACSRPSQRPEFSWTPPSASTAKLSLRCLPRHRGWVRLR